MRQSVVDKHSFHLMLIGGTVMLNCELGVLKIPLTFRPDIPTLGVVSDNVVCRKILLLRYNGTRRTLPVSVYQHCVEAAHHSL